MSYGSDLSAICYQPETVSSLPGAPGRLRPMRSPAACRISCATTGLTRLARSGSRGQASAQRALSPGPASPQPSPGHGASLRPASPQPSPGRGVQASAWRTFSPGPASPQLSPGQSARVNQPGSRGKPPPGEPSAPARRAPPRPRGASLRPANPQPGQVSPQPRPAGETGAPAPPAAGAIPGPAEFARSPAGAARITGGDSGRVHAMMSGSLAGAVVYGPRCTWGDDNDR